MYIALIRKINHNTFFNIILIWLLGHGKSLNITYMV